MSDKLVDRLRGNYQVGTNGEFGTRSFSDFIPPINLEAADKIQELEKALNLYGWHQSNCQFLQGHHCDCGYNHIKNEVIE